MSEDVRRTQSAAGDLAGKCGEVLGPNLVAAVLHGSLTLGDFESGRSDIDLMLISGPHGLAQAERDQIVQAVSNAEMAAAKAIDLVVVRSTVAGVPSRMPTFELQVSRYPDATHVEVDQANEDIAVELSMARANGRSLIGAPVEQVIAPVPDQWVRDRGLFWLRRWLTLADDAEHAELMVLTACRIWRFDTDSTYCAKPEAGRWALARDPSLTAVTQALRQRRGQADAAIPPHEVRRVLRTALSAVGARS